jgi:hypothetical protein
MITQLQQSAKPAHTKHRKDNKKYFKKDLDTLQHFDDTNIATQQ